MSRHFWVLVHRYSGLYMASFLIVAGITGSILAFSGELQRLLDPPLRVAVESRPLLDAVELRERALALMPRGQVNWVVFRNEPGDAYRVSFEPRTNPANGLPYELRFNTLDLNPYTGAEIERSQRPNEIWPITRYNLLAFIITLHYRLALPGSVGIWLFGIAALIWTFDCFVSFYLTFPLSFRRRSLSQQAPATAERRSWWARWKIAWLVKRKSSAFRLNFDLHRAGGLWVWLMLLVLAWTSVGFNLNEQVYAPVMKAVFNMPDAFGDLPTLKAPKPEPDLSWRDAHAVGRRLMGEMARSAGFIVQREETLVYVPEKGLFAYFVRSDRDLIDEGGDTYVVFDGSSGRFAGLSLPRGQNLGSTIHSWIFAFHEGKVWGLPFKIFLCFTGLVIAMLSITGVYIWLRKRNGRKLSASRGSALKAAARTSESVA